MTERDDLGIDDAELEGFPALEPPGDFVDRVMSARADRAATERTSTERTSTEGTSTEGTSTEGTSTEHTSTEPPVRPERARRAWRERAVVALVAAAAAVALTVGAQRLPLGPVSGHAEVAARREIRLGARGVAVAEAGAALSWEVARGGETRVDQRAGRVFYRVEPGDEFTVSTPGGLVRVRGTCFDVEVRQMSTETLFHRLGRTKQLALGAVAGAAVASAVIVTVYEGRVDVESAGETQPLVAGESAIAADGVAPARVKAKLAALEEENARLSDKERALKAQLDEIEGQLKVVMKAQANGEDPLVAENKSLRDELRAVRAELSAFEQERAARAGAPVPWPDDMPAAFREQGVKRAILDAIEQAGLQGDLVSIDCSEFPCVAYGEVVTPGDKEANEAAMKRFDEGLRGTYPPEGNSMHQSVWSKSERTDAGLQHRSHFGIAVYPDSSVDGETRGQVDKRLRWRNQQYMDAALNQ